MEDATQYVQSLGHSARRASQQLVSLDGKEKVAALQRIAQALRNQRDVILAANQKDIDAAEQAQLARPLIERLKLDEKKVEQMAISVDQIAAQVDPVGQTIEGYVRPNGLRIEARCAGRWGERS